MNSLPKIIASTATILHYLDNPYIFTSLYETEHYKEQDVSTTQAVPTYVKFSCKQLAAGKINK